MAEYIDREKLKTDFDNKAYYISHGRNNVERGITLNGINQIVDGQQPANVIERAEYDRTVQAFKVLVESKNENLKAMRNEYYTLEKEYAELKVNIDKAIEEMRVESNNIDYHANKLLGASYGIRKSIDILKGNIGE